MKRLRHLAFTAQRGGEQIREGEQQPTPIYIAIAQDLRYADILRRVQYDDCAYETDVLWLLQHLPATANRNDVDDLLKERFAEQQGSPQCDPDDVLRMQALAADMWHAWSQYRQRNETAALTQKTHARSRMRRFYSPDNR
jgi:hypothetical protein